MIGHLIILILIPAIWAKNTLLIIADDAGLEAGYLGNPVIKTPNIDQLSRKSIIFTNAFTSVSSCSPSRSAILTGLPIHQNGMYGLHHGAHHFNSFDEVRSLSSMLKNGTSDRILTGIIGKKHVGPESVYSFDIEHTEENNSIMQVGRNITKIKDLDFLLYVAFHDPHRCGHTNPEYGSFCEKFGNGASGMGTIPDWKPVYYKPEEIVVPFFVQDTPAAREDIANQYTTISRLDQGIGLLMGQLKYWNLENDTLVIYSSDNGIPFPSGRTNFYEPGIHQPLMVSSPPGFDPDNMSSGKSIDVPVSLLDIVPTIMDWHNISMPLYSILKQPISYTGLSLLSKRQENVPNLLQRTLNNQTLNWYKSSLKSYYQRPEFEFFDLKTDPEEKFNIAKKPRYQGIFNTMSLALSEWQTATSDSWFCSPHSVLEDKGNFKANPQCMPLYN